MDHESGFTPDLSDKVRGMLFPIKDRINGENLKEKTINQALSVIESLRHAFQMKKSDGFKEIFYKFPKVYIGTYREVVDFYHNPEEVSPENLFVWFLRELENTVWVITGKRKGEKNRKRAVKFITALANNLPTFKKP